MKYWYYEYFYRYRVHIVVPEHPQSQLPPFPAYEASPLQVYQLLGISSQEVNLNVVYMIFPYVCQIQTLIPVWKMPDLKKQACVCTSNACLHAIHQAFQSPRIWLSINCKAFESQADYALSESESGSLLQYIWHEDGQVIEVLRSLHVLCSTFDTVHTSGQ